MYNNLLTRVIQVVTTATEPTSSEKTEMFFESLFNPQAYYEYVESRRRKEELGRKIILGATVAAVCGEGIHLVKRSGILNRFKR